MTYRRALELGNEEIFCGLSDRLAFLCRWISRLEHCVNCLEPPLAELLQSYYFKRLTWREIQSVSAEQIAVKTLMARRDRAVQLVAEQFQSLLRIGALSTAELTEISGFPS